MRARGRARPRARASGSGVRARRALPTRGGRACGHGGRRLDANHKLHRVSGQRRQRLGGRTELARLLRARGGRAERADAPRLGGRDCVVGGGGRSRSGAGRRPRRGRGHRPCRLADRSLRAPYRLCGAPSRARRERRPPGGGGQNDPRSHRRHAAALRPRDRPRRGASGTRGGVPQPGGARPLRVRAPPAPRRRTEGERARRRHRILVPRSDAARARSLGGLARARTRRHDVRRDRRCRQARAGGNRRPPGRHPTRCRPCRRHLGASALRSGAR